MFMLASPSPGEDGVRAEIERINFTGLNTFLRKYLSSLPAIHLTAVQLSRPSLRIALVLDTTFKSLDFKSATPFDIVYPCASVLLYWLT